MTVVSNRVIVFWSSLLHNGNLFAYFFFQESIRNRNYSCCNTIIICMLKTDATQSIKFYWQNVCEYEQKKYYANINNWSLDLFSNRYYSNILVETMKNTLCYGYIQGYPVYSCASVRPVTKYDA